jgi:hypothetical protein
MTLTTNRISQCLTSLMFYPDQCYPVDILLAQKFYAVIKRKRNKGRNFYDIDFLLGHDLFPIMII